MSHLDFATLRDINVARCNEVFHHLQEWSATDWACAFAGETGEACNKIKKLRRGDPIAIEDIGDEIADAIIYADLLAASLGIDLAEAVRRKFNRDSQKRGARQTL